MARYDHEAQRRELSPQMLDGRFPGLWRYHELLPVLEEASIVGFGERMTPLTALSRLGGMIGVPRLSMKDESALPTGTFKARGAACGISKAKELGIEKLAMPTNGNAGAAWAAYAARAGIEAVIVIPEDAPEMTRRECAVTGAQTYLVKGSIKDAGRISSKLVGEEGYFDVATLREPYRLEGKKTLILEILEDRGWSMPDVIVYPTGGGVGIIGIYKGLQELVAMGWISGPLPRLVAVQAAGCAPIVDAYEQGAAESKEWMNPRTAAFGISVPKALGDFLVLDAVRATAGTALAVTDREILETQRQLARAEGVFCCPEGAATVAAVRRLRGTGWIAEEEEVVVLNTGTGIKYPESVGLGLAEGGIDGAMKIELSRLERTP